MSGTERRDGISRVPLSPPLLALYPRRALTTPAARPRRFRYGRARLAGLAALIGAIGCVGSLPAGWVYVTLVLVQLGCYVWYALAAGEAAKALGEKGGVYIAWILIAPFAAFVPIPVLSTAIGVSPLSIKFLLSGQLQSAIRDQTFEVIHPST